MENRKTVILQSHLDMVHQKNADTNFDFLNEGTKAILMEIGLLQKELPWEQIMVWV